ncbi:oligosaccharyl transferase stt3 subunit [Irineochytrium annulatum]|nr:oligosaccharyl transferase stt3 subunit [Irineochytrium annulatum]
MDTSKRKPRAKNGLYIGVQIPPNLINPFSTELGEDDCRLSLKEIADDLLEIRRGLLPLQGGQVAAPEIVGEPEPRHAKLSTAAKMSSQTSVTTRKSSQPGSPLKRAASVDHDDDRDERKYGESKRPRMSKTKAIPAPRKLFQCLTDALEGMNPRVFELPKAIKDTFDDCIAHPATGSYIDTREYEVTVLATRPVRGQKNVGYVIDGALDGAFYGPGAPGRHASSTTESSNVAVLGPKVNGVNGKAGVKGMVGINETSNMMAQKGKEEALCSASPLCYHCQMTGPRNSQTSLLDSNLINPPISKNTGMLRLAASRSALIRCDYCRLWWHLDCLDPPLTSVPSELQDECEIVDTKQIRDLRIRSWGEWAGETYDYPDAIRPKGRVGRPPNNPVKEANGIASDLKNEKGETVGLVASSGFVQIRRRWRCPCHVDAVLPKGRQYRRWKWVDLESTTPYTQPNGDVVINGDAEFCYEFGGYKCWTDILEEVLPVAMRKRKAKGGPVRDLIAMHKGLKSVKVPSSVNGLKAASAVVFEFMWNDVLYRVPSYPLSFEANRQGHEFSYGLRSYYNGVLQLSNQVHNNVHPYSINLLHVMFDELSWYPLGRVVGGTVYPGIMVTAGGIHWILHQLNFPVDIRNICVFLAPVFSAFTAIAAYLLTVEVKDASAGLLAAAFIGIAPGYISRSVAGSYDNEGIAIFLLMFTFYLWLKALKLGSALYGGLTAFFYFYMVSAWGGYVFIINLIPLHVLALLIMGRFSPRLYISYSSFYVIGTLASMEIPFVGFQPTRTSEHMAALGMFGLIQIVAFVEMIRSHLSANQFKLLFHGLIAGIFIVGFAGLVALTVGGYIAPFTGRFYSLWDTGYAKKYIPIIASVSEHQPTAWPSFFFDLQLLIPLFPAGVYFCFQILYAVTASYFAGVMVRLMLTLTPVVCIASAVAMSKLLDTYLIPREVTKATLQTTPPLDPKDSKESKAPERVSVVERAFGSESMVVVILSAVVLCLFTWHCTWVTSNAYSSPSIVLASRGSDGNQMIIDDFREAYYWLRQNSDEKAKIMSWWDYGYQITGMANRTVLVDNNTWNNTHIATVGKAMACSEDVSYEVMRRHDVTYVLVIFGAAIGYSGDDINKFLWMIRIGEGVYPSDISERNFFTDRGEYRVDGDATPTMKNSLMYKMSYYRFADLFGPNGQPYDRVRGSHIPKKPIKLHVIDEAFSSENMIVRIYKVKDLDNIGRSLSAAASFGTKRKKRSHGRKGK